MHELSDRVDHALHFIGLGEKPAPLRQGQFGRPVISGDNDDVDRRPAASNKVRKLYAIHRTGHLDIRNHRKDFRRLTEHRDGVVRPAYLDDIETRVREGRRQIEPDKAVVVDDQNLLSGAGAAIAHVTPRSDPFVKPFF